MNRILPARHAGDMLNQVVPDSGQFEAVVVNSAAGSIVSSRP